MIKFGILLVVSLLKFSLNSLVKAYFHIRAFDVVPTCNSMYPARVVLDFIATSLPVLPK